MGKYIANMDLHIDGQQFHCNDPITVEVQRNTASFLLAYGMIMAAEVQKAEKPEKVKSEPEEPEAEEPDEAKSEPEDQKVEEPEMEEPDETKPKPSARRKKPKQDSK